MWEYVFEIMICFRSFKISNYLKKVLQISNYKIDTYFWIFKNQKKKSWLDLDIGIYL